ncbi:MAG: hypothetical protein MK193_09265 [Lentisphaeria bacterium]|nr:hypothetical protein [Lentisphaeria bacterium]
MLLVFFIIRHFILVLTAILLAALSWTVVYLLCLLIALLSGQDMGGILAYPAWLIFITSIIAVFGWGVFAPACGIGLLCCKKFKLPNIYAPPIVFATAVFLSFHSYRFFAEIMDLNQVSDPMEFLKYFLLYATLPLSIYWLISEGPVAVWDLLKRLFRRKPKKIS